MHEDHIFTMEQCFICNIKYGSKWFSPCIDCNKLACWKCLHYYQSEGSKRCEECTKKYYITPDQSSIIYEREMDKVFAKYGILK